MNKLLLSALICYSSYAVADATWINRTLTPLSQTSKVIPLTDAVQFGTENVLLMKVLPSGQIDSDANWRLAKFSSVSGFHVLDSNLSNGLQLGNGWQVIDADRIVKYDAATVATCSFSANKCNGLTLDYKHMAYMTEGYDEFYLRPNNTLTMVRVGSEGEFNGNPAWAFYEAQDIDLNAMKVTHHTTANLPVDQALTKGLRVSSLFNDDQGNGFVTMYTNSNGTYFPTGTSDVVKIFKIEANGTVQNISFNPAVGANQTIKHVQTNNRNVVYSISDSNAVTFFAYNIQSGKTLELVKPQGNFVSAEIVGFPGSNKNNLLVIATGDVRYGKGCDKVALNLDSNVQYNLGHFYEDSVWYGSPGCGSYDNFVGFTNQGTVVIAINDKESTGAIDTIEMRYAKADGTSFSGSSVPNEVISYFSNSPYLYPRQWASTYQDKFSGMAFGNSGTIFLGYPNPPAHYQASAFLLNKESGDLMQKYLFSADTALNFPMIGSQNGYAFKIEQISSSQGMAFEYVQSNYHGWGIPVYRAWLFNW